MQANSEFQAGCQTRRVYFGLRRVFVVLPILAVFFALLRVALIRREETRLRKAERRNAYELSLLDNAIEYYGQRYGELPPTSANRITDHLARIFPRFLHRLVPEEMEARLTGRDLAEIDEREALVFWLSGEAESLVVGNVQSGCYQFDTWRLVDSDQDGWLEYVDSRGNAFRYLHGVPAVYCPETDRWISPTPFRSGQQGRTPRRIPSPSRVP